MRTGYLFNIFHLGRERRFLEQVWNSKKKAFEAPGMFICEGDVLLYFGVDRLRRRVVIHMFNIDVYRISDQLNTIRSRYEYNRVTLS